MAPETEIQPQNFTLTPQYPYYLILRRQREPEVALVSSRSDCLTLLAFGLAMRVTQLPRAKVRAVLMQRLWGRKLPNFCFYHHSQGSRRLPESHTEQQLRQSSTRLIPAVEKSEGIRGYLNEGNSTHLFKTLVRENMIFFSSSRFSKFY